MKKTVYLTSKQDGLKLEIAIMECKNPKGIVQFSHGMAEHKERYFDFMQYLNERGYIPVCYLCLFFDVRF